MEFAELMERARDVRAAYASAEAKRYGRSWTREELMLGFVGDVGDLAKLVQGKEGIRFVDGIDQAIAHELADCLWCVLVLADEYDVDLENSFVDTMADIQRRLDA